MTPESGEEQGLAEARAAARSAIDLAMAAEPAITPVVREVVEANGGTMARLETRIKGEDRLTEKISDDITSRDTAESVARIPDVLRYTAVMPFEVYWPAGTRLCEALVAVGYRHFAKSTGWIAEGYTGRNERFESLDGCRFELQIHTSASLSAADVTHAWYEDQRRPETPMERMFELQEMQSDVFREVPIPPGTPVR